MVVFLEQGTSSEAKQSDSEIACDQDNRFSHEEALTDQGTTVIDPVGARTSFSTPMQPKHDRETRLRGKPSRTSDVKVQTLELVVP